MHRRSGSASSSAFNVSSRLKRTRCSLSHGGSFLLSRLRHHQFSKIRASPAPSYLCERFPTSSDLVVRGSVEEALNALLDADAGSPRSSPEEHWRRIRICPSASCASPTDNRRSTSRLAAEVVSGGALAAHPPLQSARPPPARARRTIGAQPRRPRHIVGTALNIEPLKDERGITT